MASLEGGFDGDSLPTHLRQPSDAFLMVVRVYAPMSKSTPDKKSKFFDDLQRAIDGVGSATPWYQKAAYD